MKHLKHLCHSNKILPQLLTKSNHEEKNSPTYRSQKGVFVHSHQQSLENTSDPNTISRKSSGTNIPHWESQISVFTQKYLSILKKHYLMLSSHSSPQSSHESQAGHFTVTHWCACQDSQQDHVFFSRKTKGKKTKFISIILIWLTEQDISVWNT